jgi:hypothetical protein
LGPPLESGYSTKVRWILALAGAVAIGTLSGCGIVAGLNDYSKGSGSDASVDPDVPIASPDAGPILMDMDGDDVSAMGDDAGEAGTATCASTLSDVLNCGACGNACDVSRSQGAACIDGVCTYTGCAADWLDCDQTAPNINGCESSKTAVNSCGACGNVCDGEQSLGATCVETEAGAISCQYSGCQTGFGDCDQTPPNTKGCETSFSTAANCGGCGRACDTTNSQQPTCADGTTCNYGGCNPGHQDCNSAAPDLDGCETTVASATCNACGQPCDTSHSQGASCDTSNGATCVYTGCNTGYADCSKTSPDTNGCETSITTANNCGACGRSCDTTNSNGASCSGGNCQYTGCQPGRADCDTSNHDTNGCESSLNSTTSCGACNATCNTNTGAASCNGSTCTYQCNSGLIDCNSGNAPDTDGCECATPACCGGSCQTTHADGVGQSFYDCNASGTYNQSQAQAACTAFTGSASACSPSTVCCGGNIVVLCLGTTSKSVCGSSGGKCYCWQYDGTNPGRVEAEGSGCKASCGSNTDPQWN